MSVGVLVNVHVDKKVLKKAWNVTDIERCGYVLGTDLGGSTFKVVRLLEVPNNHPEPDQHFRINRAVGARLLQRTMFGVIGYWHTHHLPEFPDPSPDDINALKDKPHYIGLVVCTPLKWATWYNGDGIITREEY
jgi:hypothetical protein